jgi:hypothetical protein
VIGRAQRVGNVASLTELLQILAGAEAAAGTGEDDRPDVWVTCLLQRVAKVRMECAVERVQHLRSVQRDRLNGAVARDLDLSHRGRP